MAFFLSLFILLMLPLHEGPGQAVSPEMLDTFRQVNDFVDENEACFRCHGQTPYRLMDESSGRVLTRHLHRNYVIPREGYYQGNHKSFSCYDCHSPEYDIFPHPLEARLEEPWNCIDCHGGDEDYAHYNFEKIRKEYLQSIHHLANPDEFSCWKCHPHTYRINIRTAQNLRDAIAYDNAICLSCHADFDEFRLLTDREGIDILRTHDWLPNQALHFQKVRCIECHAQINDEILVAHRVLPGEQAVRRCTDCHSGDSRLMASLYRYRSREARRRYGFLNAAIINEAYVIGANRNHVLNVASLILFCLVLAGLALHIALRIIRKV